jgi:hypothetical protein
MITNKSKSALAAALSCCVMTAACVRAQETKTKTEPIPNADWVSLFDGKSLDGWKATENAESFKVADGNLVVNGNRGHLFYIGDAQPFVNFEFHAEVMTLPGSNSGVYIHTQPQNDGWPKFGYECQVNNTHSDPIKTGSIYNVVDVLQVPTKPDQPFTPGVRVEGTRVMLTVAQSPAKDNEWFSYDISVNGKRIITKVNGITLVDYTEPEGKKAGEGFTRILDKGTFALQAHDPKSKAFYRDIRVKRLP